MVVRAVLFDLGDTLIFEAHKPDAEQLYATMAEQVRPLLRDWGVGQQLDLRRLLRELYQAVETAQPDWRARGREVDGAFISRGALASYGVDVTPEQAAAFWRATDVGLAAWGCQTYPDTIDTLTKLGALALPTALVSNTSSTSEMVRPSLATVGITEQLLPVIVTSTDVMRPKPHPEPFRRALGALGIAPANAVFVGDSLEADVRGAKALGMTTVWKLNGRHEVPPAPEADYMVHDLWELFTLGLLPERAGATLPHESLMPHEDNNAGRY